jgi:hypothetical protein
METAITDKQAWSRVGIAVGTLAAFMLALIVAANIIA